MRLSAPCFHFHLSLSALSNAPPSYAPSPPSPPPRAIRHPASGYVQGINDLLTPFLTVFLSELFVGELDSWQLHTLAPDMVLRVEADCFWCLSKLLDGIQDHYTFAQPGIQRLVFKLKEIVRRIDGDSPLHSSLTGLLELARAC